MAPGHWGTQRPYTEKEYVILHIIEACIWYYLLCKNKFFPLLDASQINKIQCGGNDHYVWFISNNITQPDPQPI